MSSVSTYVHLIGGSNFDDHLMKEGQFVTKLTEKLGAYVQVQNHAYEGFTTRSILEGGEVGKDLPTKDLDQQTKKQAYWKSRYIEEEKYDAKPQAQPLELLKVGVINQADATHYVVIDVGADDIEGYWNHPTTFLDIRNLPSRVVEIVEKVVAISDKIKPILVVHPRPDFNDNFTRVMGHVARAAAGLNVLAMVTFTASAFLSVTNRVSRVKGAVVCLAVAGVFHLLRTNIAPLKVTMQFRGDIALRMIDSIWERLYRPILCHAKTENFHILDLASSHSFYEEFSTSKNKKMIIDGIYEVLNGDQKSLQGPKIITLVNGKYQWVVNEHPETWTPTIVVKKD